MFSIKIIDFISLNNVNEQDEPYQLWKLSSIEPSVFYQWQNNRKIEENDNYYLHKKIVITWHENINNWTR